MKYIISESRLDDIVMKFIDEKLKNLEVNDYNYWAVGNEEIFYIFKEGNKKGLGMSSKFINYIRKVFGLTYDDAQTYVMEWAKLHLGFKPDFIEDIEDYEI